MASRCGQSRFVDLLLVRADPRHEGEGVDRQPVRAELGHQVEARAKGRLGLQRQAVDEIEVDAVGEADAAGALHQRLRLLEGLAATDRRLHLGGEVLHAEAQAVEAEAGERLEMRRRGDPRIDFDRALGVGQKLEVAGDQAEELLELRRLEVGRRPAPPVHLDQFAALRQQARDELELAAEVVEVLRRDLALRRRDDVAAAVAAVLGAKRNVDVEAQRLAGVVAVGELEARAVLLRADAGVKLDRGRIGGVARSGAIEPLHHRGVGNRESEGHASPFEGPVRAVRACTWSTSRATWSGSVTGSMP